MTASKPRFKPVKRLDYCYCSECDHETILNRQQAQPLPFEAAMQTHCQSGIRCGRCLYPLEQLFREKNCFLVD
jgi:hypothetical protein